MNARPLEAQPLEERIQRAVGNFLGWIRIHPLEAIGIVGFLAAFTTFVILVPQSPDLYWFVIDEGIQDGATIAGCLAGIISTGFSARAGYSNWVRGAIAATAMVVTGVIVAALLQSVPALAIAVEGMWVGFAGGMLLTAVGAAVRAAVNWIAPRVASLLAPFFSPVEEPLVELPQPRPIPSPVQRPQPQPPAAHPVPFLPQQPGNRYGLLAEGQEPARAEGEAWQAAEVVGGRPQRAY